MASLGVQFYLRFVVPSVAVVNASIGAGLAPRGPVSCLQ